MLSAPPAVRILLPGKNIMAGTWITLTTDFGHNSPYVAAMKGVLIGLAPHVAVLDLSHDIPPQDITHAAFFLAQSIPYFPPQALHVVVVDPGVGTDRRLLYLEIGPHRLLAPDNGLATILLRRLGLVRAYQITDRAYFRPTISRTFHGRDILAPVAAHLANGLDPIRLGPQVTDPIQLPLALPQVLSPGHGPGRSGDPNLGIVRGAVIFVDSFGNLITNIEASLLPDARLEPGSISWEMLVAGHRITRWVNTYGEAAPGDLVLLTGSSGLVEVAQVCGNAARSLSAGRDQAVELRWRVVR